jgi:hypothetical protein
MTQREYTEDPVWFSIRDATAFAAHRRTVVLFHRNVSSLAGAPNPLTWIDNTGAVWPELISVLSTYAPKRIAINTEDDIAFAGGLRLGEFNVLYDQLGDWWMERTVSVPMLAIEFLAARMPGQSHYYKLMAETTWALIEEAFSERVIEPGVTTTTVRIKGNFRVSVHK